MSASNTPLYDLIELSGITGWTTFTPSGVGGGTIQGYVDNATYTDLDFSNTATQITELNDSNTGADGYLTIDGTSYDIYIAVPDGAGNNVTVTFDGGSTVSLSGNHYSSDIAFLTAIPTGDGQTRYFAAVDDAVGDLPNITSIQTKALDYTPLGSDVLINLDEDNSVTVCFVQGACILTPAGERPVETLQSGDLVLTYDNGQMPIMWRQTSELHFSQLGTSERRQPIRIQSGALAPGVPARDLLVSPQHRILICSDIVEELFGVPEILVPAAKLLGMPGINRRQNATRVTYHHLYLGNHQLIWANGALTESLLPDALPNSQVSPDCQDHNAQQVTHPRRARPIIDNAALLNVLFDSLISTQSSLFASQGPATPQPAPQSGELGNVRSNLAVWR